MSEYLAGIVVGLGIGLLIAFIIYIINMQVQEAYNLKEKKMLRNLKEYMKKK